MVDRVHYSFSLPTESQVEEWANELPQAYLECRVLRHHRALRIAREATFEGSSDLYIEAALYCQRCGVEWVEVYRSDTAELVWKSSPRYPDGYLRTGFGRVEGPAKRIVRAELLNRAME